MSKNTSPRDLEIFEAATSYSVAINFRQAAIITDLSEAREKAEALATAANKGAAIYAIAETCGCESGALLATYRPGKGWTEMKPCSI